VDEQGIPQFNSSTDPRHKTDRTDLPVLSRDFQITARHSHGLHFFADTSQTGGCHCAESLFLTETGISHGRGHLSGNLEKDQTPSKTLS
jgi:hypothetical protein